ncbi:MAG: glycosyltransferase family 39 protein, partial [Actinomycetota bacterium]|nr:glycosyltransferase family 39 protein [Actinomycetota bacterium]
MINLTSPDFAGIGTAPAPARSRRLPPGVWAGAGLAMVTFLGYLPGSGRSLDFDSAQTVGMFVKTGPPWSAFRLQAAFNNHPLFSFLEQLVRVVTGRTDAAAMRVLPVLCGALAVGVLTWFAARRHGLLAGLAAGALLATNPTFLSLSRAARGYSLLVLCAIVATILVADDRPDRSRWSDLAYVAVAGMGLATHLYMFPV